jgi:hypothetical protein
MLLDKTNLLIALVFCVSAKPGIMRGGSDEREECDKRKKAMRGREKESDERKESRASCGERKR